MLKIKAIGNKLKKIHKPLILCAVLLSVFAFIESKQPYFFMEDDNRDFYLPYFVHNFESLLKGELAFFNFHQFLGIPHFSSGQTAVFYPVTYLCVFASKVLFGHYFAAIDIQVIFHLLIGALGFYAFLRALELNGMAAFFGALTWPLCSFVVYVSNSWVILAGAAAYFPWMIYFAIKLYQMPAAKNIAGLVIFRLLLFYAGHIQYFIYSVIFEILTFTLLILKKYGRDKDRMYLKHILKVYTISFVFVFFLSLPLLLPMWHQTSISASRSCRLPFAEYFSESYDMFQWLTGIVFPFNDATAANKWAHRHLNSISHVGYLTVVFIVMTVVYLRREIKNEKIKQSRREIFKFGVSENIKQCKHENVKNIEHENLKYSWLQNCKHNETENFNCNGLKNIKYDELENIRRNGFKNLKPVGRKLKSRGFNNNETWNSKYNIKRLNETGNIKYGIRYEDYVQIFIILGIVAFLWSGNIVFNLVIYLIPVLNRFRWPFKMNFYTSFYLIAMSAAGLSRLLRTGSLKIKTARLIFPLIIFLQTLNFAYLYAYVPKKCFGTQLDRLPAEEPFKDRLTEGRIVSVGFNIWVPSDHNIAGFNYHTLRTLGFNYASLWDLYHFAGYEPLVPKVNAEECNYMNFDAVYNNDDGVLPIEHFRKWGVKWYVVSNDKLDKYKSYMEAKGLVESFYDEYRTVFKDNGAKPFIAPASSGESSVLSYSIETNSITFETSSPHGDVYELNFLYNPFFKAYIDGNKAKLDVNNYDQMSIYVPEGNHKVKVVYHDPYFTAGCIAALCFSMIAPLCIILTKFK